jgi:hypothetical protein
MIHRWRMQGALQSYLDDELSDAARAALARHLDRCASCAAGVRRLGEADALFAAARPTPPALMPPATQALLERALAEAATRGPGRRWLMMTWSLAAGMAVVAAGCAAWWWRPAEAAGDHQALPGLASLPVGVVVANTDPRREETQVTVNAGPRRAPAPSKRPPGPAASGRHPASNRRPTAPPASAPANGTGSLQRPRRSMPPRMRLAQSPRAALCRLPDEGWWRKLTAEVEASETSAGELSEELSLREALTGNPDREASSTQPPDDFPASEATAEAHGDAALLAENVPGELPVEPPAVAAGDSLPASDAAPAMAQVTETPRIALPPGQLLVMVSTAPSPSPVTITQAPEATPGYARAMAVRPDGTGGMTWTQATVTSEEGLKLAQVMLGGENWWE